MHGFNTYTLSNILKEPPRNRNLPSQVPLHRAQTSRHLPPRRRPNPHRAPPPTTKLPQTRPHLPLGRAHSPHHPPLRRRAHGNALLLEATQELRYPHLNPRLRRPARVAGRGGDGGGGQGKQIRGPGNPLRRSI